MTDRTFSLTVGIVFALIALLHFLRMVFAWEALIAGVQVPFSLSGLALVVSSFLAYEAFIRLK